MEPDFRGLYTVFIRKNGGIDEGELKNILDEFGVLDGFNVKDNQNYCFARFKSAEAATSAIETLSNLPEYFANPAKNRERAPRSQFRPSDDGDREARNTCDKISDANREALSRSQSVGFNKGKPRAFNGSRTNVRRSGGGHQFSDPENKPQNQDSDPVPLQDYPLQEKSTRNFNAGSDMSINSTKDRDIILIDQASPTSISSESSSLLKNAIEEAKRIYEKHCSKMFSRWDDLDKVSTPCGWKPYTKRQRPICNENAVSVYVKAHSISKQDLPILRDEYMEKMSGNPPKQQVKPLLSFHQDLIDHELIQLLPTFRTVDIVLSNLPFWYCQADVYGLLNLMVPNQIVHVDIQNTMVLGEVPYAVVHLKSPIAGFIVAYILDRCVIGGKTVQVASMDEVEDFIKTHLLRAN